MPGDSPDRDRRRITRRRGACTHCRRKKIRCNGEKPCRLCQRHGIDCSYASPASDTSPTDQPASNGTQKREEPELQQQQQHHHQQEENSQPRKKHRGSEASTRQPSTQLSDFDSMDWFLSLATPSSGSFENLTDELLLSPAAPVGSPTLQYDGANMPGLYHIDPLLDTVMLATPMESENGTDRNGGRAEVNDTTATVAPSSISQHGHTRRPSTAQRAAAERRMEMDARDVSISNLGVDPASATLHRLQRYRQTELGPKRALPPVPPTDPELHMSLDHELDLDLSSRRLQRANSFTDTSTSSPDFRKRAYNGERKRVLFPALSNLDSDGDRSRPQFDPCMSSLVSILSTAKVDDTLRQTAAELMQYLMSQQCQRSLPAAWWSATSKQTSRETSPASLHVQTLISDCFGEPLGVKLYLEPRDVLAAFKVSNSPFGQASAVDTCVMFTLAAWSSLLKGDQSMTDCVNMVVLMTEAYETVSDEPDSIEKFLALVAVIQLAHKLGLRFLPKLLASVISMIQSMSLHSEAALQSLCAHSAGLGPRVKRACWIVYCVDKVNTLRWKSFSLFPDNCLQYTPPPLNANNNGQDWLLAQWKYAQICADIHSEISRARLDKSQSRRNTASIAAELQDWYESLPEGGRLQSGGSANGSDSSKGLGIYMRYQYYEASMALLEIEQIHDDSARYSAARQRTICLIREVFKTSNRIDPDDIAYDRIAFFLPCFSLCKLVTEVLLHGTAGFEDARAVLAVAHGYFARISPMLPTHDFFNQVTELIDVAVEAHKSVT